MKPVVLLVGTDHFDKGDIQDETTTADLDIFSSKRQLEIKELVSQLAAFRPTKVCLEYPKVAQDRLTISYGKYLVGEKDLSVNEIQQIG